MNPQAIIFDCDGVLIDSEIIYNSVERDYLSTIGLNYNDSVYQQRFLGLAGSDYLRELKSDYQKLNQGEFPADFINSVRQECLKRFQSQLNAIEGVHALLDYVDCPIAVASSSSLDMLYKKLKITNLQHYFDPHIYSGEDVPLGKPSADIFLYSAEKLFRKPEQCLVIEDSVNGVYAGVAAGMEVWGFTGGSHCTGLLESQLKQAGAIRVFSNYTDLQALI